MEIHNLNISFVCNKERQIEAIIYLLENLWLQKILEVIDVYDVYINGILFYA
jgi:hypothetical protein